MCMHLTLKFALTWRPYVNISTTLELFISISDRCTVVQFPDEGKFVPLILFSTAIYNLYYSEEQKI